MITNKGFTLIELLVVVAIIGILAAVGVTAYSGYINSARISNVKSNHDLAVKTLRTQLLRVEIENQIEAWDSASRTCKTREAHQNYDYNVSLAFSCLNDDPKYKNPFNESDNEGAFWQNWDVPSVKFIGRTACNFDGVKVICNSRWGEGANDYETTIIPR